MKKTVNKYMKMPYKKEYIENEDGTYFIKVKELPGCMSEGDTLKEANMMILDAMELWITEAIKNGKDIPLPEELSEKYSGKILIRIPHDLHRQLTENAERNKTSLNMYITYLLSSENAKYEMIKLFSHSLVANHFLNTVNKKFVEFEKVLTGNQINEFTMFRGLPFRWSNNKSSGVCYERR